MKYYIRVELDVLDGGIKEVRVSKTTFFKYQKLYGCDVIIRCGWNYSFKLIRLFPDQMSMKLFNYCKRY